MKKRSLLITVLLFIVILPGCSQTWENHVQHTGALRNAMVHGDISAKIQLSELAGLDNLYALGAVGELNGEVQIFDSQPSITYVEDGNLLFDTTFQSSASFIVYAQVKTWQQITIPSEVVTRDQFEEYLQIEAERIGLNTDEPFPFLLSGNFAENSWHVIQWDPSDTVHTHEKHIESGLFGKMENKHLEMLGFFSKNHAGVFTHHTTFMHLHYITEDGLSAGHSDDFILGDSVVLSLPIE